MKAKAKRRPPRRLPGDPSPSRLRERAIRVDHAGEYGAVRIYEGQLRVLGQSRVGSLLREMRDEEAKHLEIFNRLIAENRVRPSALLPLWHVGGFLLGAGTALLGEKAAMACTAAVEEVIEQHYQGQIDSIGADDRELEGVIAHCRAGEVEHRETALRHGAEDAPAHGPLSEAIKAGCRLAIWIAERV